MLKTFAFDWIRVTTKNHNPMEMVRQFDYGLSLDHWKATKPHNGYSHALTHPYGHSILWHIDKSEMGVNIMFPGRACNELYERGIDVHSLISWFIDNGFKFTRLDLAIDVKNVEIDIVGLLECEHSGSINNDPVLIQKGKKARGGATLYCGSWSSEKFMRIYDKAKERGLKDVMWTRIEVEVKGKTATKIALDMSTKSIQECAIMTQRIIKGLYNPENEVFQEVFTGIPQRVSSTKNEEHDTYKWIMTVVAKSIARTMIELPHKDVWRELELKVQEHIKDMSAHRLT